MAKNSGNRKRFNENNPVRAILTPSNDSQSAISGGINDFMINSFKEKEAGISTVLGTIVGSNNVDSFEKLKSAISVQDTIFAPTFGKDLLSILRSIDTNISKNVSVIGEIKDSIYSLAELMAVAVKDGIFNSQLTVALDTSNAANFKDIMKSVSTFTADKNTATALQGVQKIESTFEEINKLADSNGIIYKAIENVNNIPEINQTGQKNLRALVSFFTSVSQFNNINTKELKVSSKEINNFFKDLDKVIDTIAVLDISDKVDVISEKLESLRKLYSDDIAITAKTISEHDKDLDAIKQTSDKTTEVATSAAKVDKKVIEESTSNISDIIDAITMMSVMMLIGGYIIYKHPELIKASLLFGATLSLFLMELMVPMALINLIVARKETKASLGSLFGLIAGLSLVMILGAFIVNAKDIVEPALKFGFILTAFLTMLMLPISLMALVSGKDTFENINKINSVVIMSSLLMLIGSYVIDYINISSALKFGVVLGLFIAAVLAPFMIYGLFVRKATDISKSILALIITCTIIMSIGAFFMSSPTFVHNALMFGVVLGTFILLTLTPIMLFALLKEHVAKTIKTVLWYVVTCTLIMLIGARLVNDAGFVRNALAFGLLLMAFMTLTLLPIVLFSRFARMLAVTLVQVVAFMAVSTFIMMVGALFVADKRLVFGALAFGLLLGLFMTTMLAPFLILRGPLKFAERQLLETAVFIAACGLTLALTTYIVDKYGWKALLAVALIDTFVWSLMAIVKSVSRGLNKADIINANLMMQGISLFLLVTTASLLLLNFVKPSSLAKLLALEVLISIMVGMVVMIPKVINKIEIQNALTVMTGITGVILVATVTLLLLNFVKWSSLLKLTCLELAVSGMIFLIKIINKGLDRAQVINAAIIMGAIAATILIISNALILLNFVNWESLGKLACLELAVAGMIFIIKLVTKELTVGQTLKASVLMGAIAGTLLIAANALILLNFVSWESLPKLLALEVIIGLMVAIVKFIPKGINLADAAIACLVMGMISVTMMVASAALLILNSVKKDSINKLALLELCVLGMIGIAAIAGIPTLVPLIAIGTLVIGMLEVLMLGLAVTIVAMVGAIKLAETVKNPDSIKTVFTSFINTIQSIPINPLKLAVLTAKGIMISALILAIAPALALLSITVSGLSNLKIATSWGPDGKPTSYRHLNQNDFKNAASNISALITTLSSGILSASKEIKKIDVKTLLKTLYFSQELGTVISSIAEGVKSYAQLMIPDRWNEDGKPISYHLMKSEEFDAAAKNISTIILTVGGAIARIASGKGEITLADGTKFSAADYMKVLQGDNWWTGKSDFTKVLNASSKLGEMISNIASGVGAFAKLMVPIRWNDEGKPVAFRQLNENDINLAIKHIGEIITATAQPILKLASDPEYFGLFDTVMQSTGFLGMNIKESDSKFMKVLAGAMQLGQMISNLASGVQSMANLRFVTKYDNNGNAVEWVSIGNEDFKVVSANIQRILTASIEGIKAAMPFMFSPDKLKEVIDAITPIGDIIGKTATGISNMAELKVATEYDENGKATKWRQLGEQDFTNAANNISRIITITAEALLLAYAKYEEKYDADTMKRIFEGMKPVTDIINSIANSIINLACGKVTIDGKDHLINANDITRAKENIETLLTTTVDTIIAIVDKYPDYFNGDNVLSNIAMQLNDTITLVGGIADSISKFVEIKNVDNALENIKKLLNNETGIISSTLAGFSGITNEDVNMLPIYSNFINGIMPVFESLIKYSDMILKNKAILNDIVTYSNKESVHGSAGIFSDIDFILNGVLISKNENDIKSLASGNIYLEHFTTYMSLYKDILEYIIDSIYPLLDEIESIYDRYFSAEQSISFKINTIIDGIRSTISTISPNETKKRSILDLFRKSDNRRLIEGLNNFREQVSLYVEILSIINKIPNVSISNEKLNTASIAALFDKKSQDVTIYSALNTFTSLNDISARDLRNAIKRIETFNDIVIKLIEISSHGYDELNVGMFTSINAGIDTIGAGVNKAGEINNKALENFSKETHTLDRFVQAVDRVDVSKVTKLTDLMSTMSELATKMGGFNELVKLIDGDLVDVLAKLSEKVEDAKKTISTAERIESERQRRFQANINQLTKLIDNPINVKVGNLDNDNTISAGYEKTKK